MRNIIAIIAVLASLSLTAPAADAQTDRPKSEGQAELVLHGATRIRAYAVAKDSKGVYLQDSRRDWFYASFVPPCYAADVASSIALKPFAGGNRLILGDTIVVGLATCEIDTLVRSGPPSTRPRRVFAPRWSMRPNPHLGPGWR
jgi:hypothetical protein